MLKSIPNILTWSRLVLAPVVAILYLAPGFAPLAAFVLFVLLSITDYLDGKLAREQGWGSSFGVFLDPVADKVLVIVVLLALLAPEEPMANRALLALIACLIIVREVAQSALRDWMAQSGREGAVRVTGMSKTKTALQITGLCVALGHAGLRPLGLDWAWLGWLAAVVLLSAAAVGWWSMVQFMQIAFAGKQRPEAKG